MGEVFNGRVSGVVAFGCFVQLDEVFADGLIHIKELDDDYYEFDERRHRLVGERTGRVWRLGDKVKVKLVRVDLDSFQIEVVPVGIKPDRRAMQAKREKPVARRRNPRRGRPPQKGKSRR